MPFIKKNIMAISVDPYSLDGKNLSSPRYYLASTVTSFSAELIQRISSYCPEAKILLPKNWGKNDSDYPLMTVISPNRLFSKYKKALIQDFGFSFSNILNAKWETSKGFGELYENGYIIQIELVKEQ